MQQWQAGVSDFSTTRTHHNEHQRQPLERVGVNLRTAGVPADRVKERNIAALKLRAVHLVACPVDITEVELDECVCHSAAGDTSNEPLEVVFSDTTLTQRDEHVAELRVVIDRETHHAALAEPPPKARATWWRRCRQRGGEEARRRGLVRVDLARGFSRGCRLRVEDVLALRGDLRHVWARALDTRHVDGGAVADRLREYLDKAREHALDGGQAGVHVRVPAHVSGRISLRTETGRLGAPKRDSERKVGKLAPIQRAGGQGPCSCEIEQSRKQ